eukprot:s179_g12.t1
MATPVKSPLQKKHKGDDSPEDEDLQITAVTHAPAEQSITLKAFENLLDQKLVPMHHFLQQIHLDLNAFKDSVRKEFDSVGLHVTAIEEQAATTMSRLEQLEKEISNLKINGNASAKEAANPRPLSMVIGNIPKASSLEEAKAWLIKHCNSTKIPAPTDSQVYSKGTFSGLLFVKCQSETHRESLIQSIREVAKETQEPNAGGSGSSRLFAKVDLTFDARAVESTLYAMKKMLISWHFHAACLKYDLQQGSLTVAGREIVRLKVDNFSMIFEWCDGEWEKWNELHESTELADIKSKAGDRLQKAKDRVNSKGKGKGPE